MAITPVSAGSIVRALKVFDETVRQEMDHQGWESNMAQKHAIQYEGRLYPPKLIISMATGMPVNSFSGGPQSNTYLTKLGFQIVPMRSQSKPIPAFNIGRTYDRRTEIHGPFGGNAQSGVASSATTDAVFVFTGQSGERYGYFDKEEIDEQGCRIFTYTGEGQIGDMTFDRGNLAIRDHAAEGRALHLFQSLGKSKGQRYIGEYVYVDHTWSTGPDITGEQRKIIIFHLVAVQDLEGLESSPDVSDRPPIVINDIAEAKALAIAASNNTVNGGASKGTRNLYKRSKAVKDYVLLRAAGICELCKIPAPFSRLDGTPYLEPHHTTKLSDGGPDHPRHVGAICPSCHREIHHGALGTTKNASLITRLLELEGEA